MKSQVHFQRESVTDDLLDALAHEHRRQTIRILMDTDGAVSLSHLADELAKRESATEDEVPIDSYRLKSRLHHLHLPKLADADLVVYAFSDEWNWVMFSGSQEKADTVLDLLTSFED